MAFEDNGSMVEPPRLSNHDNFPTWKNRMITFLISIDIDLLTTITKGLHIPPLIIPPDTHNLDASNARVRWLDEKQAKVALDSKAKHFLALSLPDDIYRLVMYCESAKEMWDNLIVLFEGTDETRECRSSLLIHQYNSFKYKPHESLTKTYTRFNYLINDLKQLNKTYDNEDMLIKFLTSVPPHLETKSMAIRQSMNLQTMTLQSLYGTLLAHEEKRRANKVKREIWPGASISEDEDLARIVRNRIVRTRIKKEKVGK